MKQRKSKPLFLCACDYFSPLQHWNNAFKTNYLHGTTKFANKINKNSILSAAVHHIAWHRIVCAPFLSVPPKQKFTSAQIHQHQQWSSDCNQIIINDKMRKNHHRTALSTKKNFHELKSKQMNQKYATEKTTENRSVGLTLSHNKNVLCTSFEFVQSFTHMTLTAIKFIF